MSNHTTGIGSYPLFYMTQASAQASISTRHRWLPVNREGLLYRGGVLVRALVAILGGYLFSALLAAVLAVYLPADRLEASLTGTLVAVTVYPCAVMWVFAARTALRAMLGLLLPCVALAAVVALHFYGGAAP
jgi:hypothetical protein